MVYLFFAQRSWGAYAAMQVHKCDLKHPSPRRVVTIDAISR
jgi:hypothetical protein